MTVDQRFYLANERTFLAWMRTGLGLVAGGVALDQFFVSRQEESLVIAVSIALVAFGAVVALVGTIRWVRADRALRENRPLGSSPAIILVGIAFAVIFFAVVVLLLVSS